jgi:hypothetical protein
MYKDKEVNKKVKNIFLSMCDVSVFDIYFTEFGTALTTYAFLKKWWVELDFKAPNLPLSFRLKGSGCHYNSIYNNTGIK